MSHEAINLPRLMRDVAEYFIAELGDCAETFRLPSPSLPPCSAALVWQNTLFTGAKFRRAHIETFEIIDRFAVLHACVLPHLDDPSPIYGFDMISGQTQATGIFLDFSPVSLVGRGFTLSNVMPVDMHERFQRRRDRPDWGGIFSNDFLAIRPVCEGEVKVAMALAQSAFSYYLERLIPGNGIRLQNEVVVHGQAAYAASQRMNPHTFRMLTQHIGPGPAKTFIEDVLFPLPA